MRLNLQIRLNSYRIDALSCMFRYILAPPFSANSCTSPRDRLQFLTYYSPVESRDPLNNDISTGDTSKEMLIESRRIIVLGTWSRLERRVGVLLKNRFEFFGTKKLAKKKRKRLGRAAAFEQPLFDTNVRERFFFQDQRGPARRS
ncbi:uncharacterized protein LOC143149413 [Ptiloglossa arizonensis]|uniref:uncharacterized protein LOC143149413 n=1 Tax=Ptiloglossa arizonensis TaxID=3350558 RepID=UPI003FA0D95D